MAYKVLVINGSPKANGCTATALDEVIRTLNQEGVETTLLQSGRVLPCDQRGTLRSRAGEAPGA